MMRKKLCWALFCAAALPAFGWAEGRQPDSSTQAPTGTTEANGTANRQTGTITSNNGNSAHATSPVGTDSSAGPANRNPYNDPTYRSGAPGTSASGFSQGTGVTPQSAETLGTAAPAQIHAPTPGLSGNAGQSSSVIGQPAGNINGVSGALPGNPGPVGNVNTPTAAPTTGNVGANGAGASGTPGSISNSGTKANEGSGF